jgi:hypothetical protein
LTKQKLKSDFRKTPDKSFKKSYLKTKQVVLVSKTYHFEEQNLSFCRPKQLVLQQ